MNDRLFPLKTFLYICIFSLFILLCSLIVVFNHSGTLLVFCDVGQGDGAYLRIKNTVDVIIDAGPDERILTCLSKYMPVYDRTIELAFISHPQKDHYGGFTSILRHYHIKTLIVPPLDSDSQGFSELKSQLSNYKTDVIFSVAPQRIELSGDFIYTLWPTADYLKTHLKPIKNSVWLKGTMDPNDISQIFVFEENGFRALFTGDASPATLNLLSDRSKLKADILKVPHHGSHNGLTEKFLNLADPTSAVISVGKHNSFGHPSKNILDLLKAKNINIRRTDIDGDVVFRLPVNSGKKN